MSLFQTFFGWPNGAVWGNIAASIIWGAPAAALITWRFSRVHRTAAQARARIEKGVAALHRRLDGDEIILEASPPGDE